MSQPDRIEVAMGPRWYRFAYLSRGRKGEDPLPQRTRDAEAALALQPALHLRGYHYAGPIFNYPPDKPNPREPVAFDDSFLRPCDLLVLTTRPPLDDLIDGVRGLIPRSHTTLEARVFACMRRHLVHCSRARVTVAELHTRDCAEIAKLGNIQFRQKSGAAIDAVLGHNDGRWQRGKREEPVTVAYLIHERQAWASGPGLLASFGMSGVDTLGWNAILARKHADLVASVPFLMAKISAPPRPQQPQTLDFLHDWKVQLVRPDTPAVR